MALKKIGTLAFFRASLFLAFLSLAVLVLLSLTALLNENNLNVVAHVFSATKDSGAMLHEFSQLKTLSPMEEGDRKKIDEMLMRYYLSMRYEQIPDSREMAYRWGVGGPLYLLSLPSVYNAFSKDLKQRLDSLPAIVSLLEIEEVNRQDNVFNVNFRIHESLPNNRIRTQEKNVILEFRYFPARRRFSPIFTNPFGLVFVRFEERERKTTSD